METNLVVDLLHKFLQVLPQFRETAVAAGGDFFSLHGFFQNLSHAPFPPRGPAGSCSSGHRTSPAASRNRCSHTAFRDRSDAPTQASVFGWQSRLPERLAAGWVSGVAPTPSRSLCASRRPAPPPKIRTHHAAGCT